jgi:hypothetical protein
MQKSPKSVSLMQEIPTFFLRNTALTGAHRKATVLSRMSVMKEIKIDN